MTTMFKFAALASAVLAAPSMAATTLSSDAFMSFNGTNGAGGFFYGVDVGGTYSDLDVTSNGTTCALDGGTCLTSSIYPGNDSIPFVSKGGTYPTVTYTGTTLAVHPLADGTNTAGVFGAYQATQAGTYNYSILLEAIGQDSTNGVGYTLFKNNALGTRTLLGTYLATASLNSSVYLNAGDRFGVLIDANGNYGGDSTALTFGIASVPEPAAWALMIGGFGMVGGAMRRRRTLVAA